MRNHYAIPYTSEGVVTPRRIVKAGAAAGGVLQASAATDKLMGVADSLGADAAGKRCEVYKEGVVDVDYGGAVAVGDPLTADAQGRAVAAAPAAGSNVRIVGFAEVAGVLGDIGEVFLSPSIMQG